MSYFIQSLNDALENRICIDMISLSGPDFNHIDNRLLSLYLVKYNLSDVTMFTASKKSIHASEWLYRKSLMVVRGHFRPPTLVTKDVFEAAYKQFEQEDSVDPDSSELVAEITLENLRRGGPINDEDYLARAEMLCAMGYNVIVSDCSNHQNLINYLADYKIQKLGLVIGAKELLEIITDKYTQNQDGRLLVAFGELFTRNIKIYVYPALSNTNGLMNYENLNVPEGIRFLYKHLLDSRQIVGVTNYNEDLLNIFPHDVIAKISSGEEGWESFLPKELGPIIRENGLFGSNS